MTEEKLIKARKQKQREWDRTRVWNRVKEINWFAGACKLLCLGFIYIIISKL